MTSSTSLALRLPDALTRTFGISATPSPRHLAPEDPNAEPRIVPAGPELPRVGRHAEPEWSRMAFDRKRDDDPFEWLGFSSARE
jgi:hypothetical protein